MGSCCKRREGMDTHCEHMSKSVQGGKHPRCVSEGTFNLQPDDLRTYLRNRGTYAVYLR